MKYINYNGKITNEESVRISPANRAFRYADGFFETMKLVDGKVVLHELHMERLYTSLNTLKFIATTFPPPVVTLRQINELAQANGCIEAARVRLTVFAGNGALHQNISRTPNYLIEATPLESKEYTLNESGLTIDIFKDAVKPCDLFSAIKSNNFLPYVMASIWATGQSLDDALLLNPYENIADATIANVFIIKDGTIKTPPLSDGPVNGVMRKHLLKCIAQGGLPFAETSLNVEDVLQASEVFVTNAIRGIRWVRQIRESEYTNQLSSYLHAQFVASLIV